MNWGALITHFVKGSIDGFLAYIGIAAIVPDVSFVWSYAALTAAFIGGLRAIQEYLTPTSYVREPTTAVAKKLAAKPK